MGHADDEPEREDEGVAAYANASDDASADGVDVVDVEVEVDMRS